MDDSVRSLLRFVARGFYTQTYVLIMDAIILHSVLSEDDLIYLLGIQRKELRAFCYKLVEDRLLVAHVQQEENPQLRLTRRTYYYIHITEAIDAIKWKVHLIVDLIKEEMSKYGNPQGYLCPRCGKKISQLDAILLISEDMANFICDNCGGVLVEDDLSQQATIRQAKLEKLMVQVDPIISYLKKIDDSFIADNTFESSLEKAIPAQASTTGTYAPHRRSNVLFTPSANSQKSQATLHVSITANDENYEKEQEEKKQRREKLEQNALPSWHLQSTVGKSGSGVGHLAEDDEEEETRSSEQTTEETEVKKEIKTEDQQMETETIEQADKDKEAQEALTTYYAQLAEREAEEDEDDDDDEDDFDDFEDV